jgi:hypothetical protein
MTTSDSGPGETRFGRDDEETRPVARPEDPPEDTAAMRIEDTSDAAGFRDPGVHPTIAMPSEPMPSEPMPSEPVGTTESAVVVEPLGAETGLPPERGVPAETGLTTDAGIGPAAAVGTGAGIGTGAGTVPTADAPDQQAELAASADGSAVEQFRDRGRAALAVLADFARQRPAAFLAGAALAGVVASRVLGPGRDED